jgi:hypothetical protein
MRICDSPMALFTLSHSGFVNGLHSLSKGITLLASRKPDFDTLVSASLMRTPYRKVRYLTKSSKDGCGGSRSSCSFLTSSLSILFFSVSQHVGSCFGLPDINMSNETTAADHRLFVPQQTTPSASPRHALHC